MNEKIRELEDQIDRLRRIAIGLKADLNVRDTRIHDLGRELLYERRQVRSLEANTQSMKKLEILDENEDDNGFDPRNSGIFKSPWKHVR